MKQCLQTRTYWNGSLQKERLDKLNNESSTSIKDLILGFYNCTLEYLGLWEECFVVTPLWLNILIYFEIFKFGLTFQRDDLLIYHIEIFCKGSYCK